ncbi:protein NATD1 isoform X1 [Monodelphis domestica]|uniref:protein NATD1 isoform X1 n=1 Tax=Monodelphis domestica TaxID=13616 RepID=UPI0024E236DF|nr:protein NATD1 isoform X1 [Monodelphis domestica]
MAHSAQLNILEQNCPIQVEHDRKRRQFTVKLNGCHDRAVLLYEYVGKRIVDLQHTEVPDAYRGRGIAKHLAKTGLGSHIRKGQGGKEKFKISKKKAQVSLQKLKLHEKLEGNGLLRKYLEA